MAQVTVELRHLLERTDFKLFDFDYEAEPEFKEKIEQAIIDHYYFYEIGSETPDRFKQRFISRYRRVISYYNELYKTSKLEYDPLQTYYWNETYYGDTSQNENATTDLQSKLDAKRVDNTHEKVDTFNRNIDDHVRDDYPQNAGVGSGYDAERNYTTESKVGDVIKKNTGDVTNNEDRNDKTVADRERSGTNDYVKYVDGMTAPPADLIAAHRRNILRLTGAVLDEMRKCFILIY